MKIKVNNDCIDSSELVSIEEYAKMVGCTRQNIYHKVKENNVDHIKIGNNTFIILQSDKK